MSGAAYWMLSGGVRSRSPVWPLVPDGQIFRVNGKVVRPFGCTAFQLGDLIVKGQAVNEFLDWVQETGIDSVRWFLGMKYVPENRGRKPWLLRPDEVEQVLTLLEGRGLGSEMTTGDMQILLPDFDDQLQYFESIDHVGQKYKSAWSERCNEHFKNGVDVVRMGRVGKMLQASGNYRLKDEPVKNNVLRQTMPAVLDLVTLHPVRKSEWPRTPKDAYELYNGWNVKNEKGQKKIFDGAKVPFRINEGIGADEVMNPWSRSNVPNDFFDYGACAKLFAAAIDMHASDLITTKVPGPIQQQCTLAMLDGWRSVSDDAIFGGYTAGHHGGCPLEHSDAKALRTFGRISGNKAEMVVIRPTGHTRADRVVKNGWRIVETHGERHNIVRLER